MQRVVSPTPSQPGRRLGHDRRRLHHWFLVLLGVATLAVLSAPRPAEAAEPDEQLVIDAYEGLLGRSPDAGGLRYWTDRLASGASASNILAGIGNADEQRRLVVTRAYEHILQRSPDAGGLDFWADGLITRRSARRLHAELYASKEFFTSAGGTNPEFVDAFYESAFRRAPDATGREFWLNRLGGGLSRYHVARQILAAPEAALQPEMAVTASQPAAGLVTTSLRRVTITLDRPVLADAAAVLVSVDGRMLRGVVTSGGSKADGATTDTLVFTPTNAPRWVPVGTRAAVVVTVFAHDGSGVERTDFDLSLIPASHGGSRDELIVAFYGHARTPLLGVAGEGTPQEAYRRLLLQAEAYRADGRPIVPSFELIATVATAAPGVSGDYNNPTPEADLRRYLDVLRANGGGHLILDIQPGRADFEPETRRYQSMLLEPEVSIALDPEWRVGPNEQPAGTVGSVDASEINRVTAYLSELVLANNLPNKLVMIHRFEASMVTNTDAILSRPGIDIVFQADGEGGPAAKIADYVNLLPDRFGRGFKIFYDEDVNRMTPAQVLALDPAPDYVSYQ